MMVSKVELGVRPSSDNKRLLQFEKSGDKSVVLLCYSSWVYVCAISSSFRVFGTAMSAYFIHLNNRGKHS